MDVTPGKQKQFLGLDHSSFTKMVVPSLSGKHRAFFFFYLFLAVSGLSSGTQDLSLRHMGSLLRCIGFSLVVARRLQSMQAL